MSQDKLIVGNKYYVSDAPEAQWGESNKDEFEFFGTHKGHPYFARPGVDGGAMRTWKYWKSVPEKKFVEWDRKAIPSLPFFVLHKELNVICEVVSIRHDRYLVLAHERGPLLFPEELNKYLWSDNGVWKPCGELK